MIKLLASIVLVITLGSAAWAAQIGDTVESKIGIADRIDIPRNVAFEVTHIDLDDGVWDVSGAIQLFEGFINQAAIAAGSLEQDRTTFNVDGTQVFMSVLAGQPFVGLALSSRAIDVNGSATIYLLAYNQSAQVTLRPQAWGFVSARKIRNNH
jgi:hypothetical protein